MSFTNQNNVLTQDFTSKIDKIVLESGCGKHRAQAGQPCWSVPTNRGDILRAVCARRTRKIFLPKNNQKRAFSKPSVNRKEKKA